MRGRGKATTCRYCGEGGDLDHGAHLRCKYLATRKRKRQPGPCTRCQVKDRLLTSSLGLCQECAEANKKESIRKAQREWYQRKKAANSLPEPAICKCGCGKPVEDRRRRLYATKECMEKVSNAKHIEKQRVRRGSAPKQPKRIVVVQARPARKVQERPYAESKEVSAPKPEVIIVPPHVTVTRIPPPPVFARGLRNLFGDENGQTWSAVD